MMVGLVIDMVAEEIKQHQSTSDELKVIEDEIAACTKCPLSKTRTNTVPGEGAPSAEVMFVGEGPGADEDQSGRPFVGRAGRLLDELIESLPMRRKDVYIANVVKCRPPGNRDPERDEVNHCRNYLERQIDAIDPVVIVPLGRHALNWFLPNLRITASNGKTFRYGDRALMPLLHPSAGLRSTDNKRLLAEGIRNLPNAILEGIRFKRDAATKARDLAEKRNQPDTIQADTMPTPTQNAVVTPMSESSASDSRQNGAGIFERSQTEDEVQAELKRQRALEEAEQNAANEQQSVEVDDRQSSLF